MNDFGNHYHSLPKNYPSYYNKLFDEALALRPESDVASLDCAINALTVERDRIKKGNANPKQCVVTWPSDYQE